MKNRKLMKTKQCVQLWQIGYIDYYLPAFSNKINIAAKCYINAFSIVRNFYNKEGNGWNAQNCIVEVGGVVAWPPF